MLYRENLNNSLFLDVCSWKLHVYAADGSATEQCINLKWFVKYSWPCTLEESKQQFFNVNKNYVYICIWM